MSRFRFPRTSLETDLVYMYSPADGKTTEKAWPRFSDDPHRDHAAVWFLGLYQAPGDETEYAQAIGGSCAIYLARAWRHTSLSRRVLQWLGQGGDADDNRRWRTLVGHGAVEGRGVSLHVRDRRQAVDHAATS
jgi:hypothetical protein